MSATSSYAPVFIKEENSRAENPKSDYSAPVSTTNEDSGAPAEQENNACDGGVADDSQTDDNDLYLADCRILIVGFNASEMRKLVNLVRKGGGSHYMCFGEKLTHNSWKSIRERADIVEWVNQGGGVVVEDQNETNVHFIVECHGIMCSENDGAAATVVSSHWIKSCLEDECLLDVGSHILYSPLPCRVPFPAFQSFRLCVSQYDEKERQLLRNLCFTIGAKFIEKLTKRVTHLLCKFSSGPKYESACKWGIQPVTCEWIYECIRQNKIVSADPFYPKEVTSEDREAGVCTTSQFPTQAVRMISGDTASQPQTQPQLINVRTEVFAGRSIAKEEMKYSSRLNKKARLLVVEEPNCSLSCLSNDINASCGENPPEKNLTGNTKEDSSTVPDVAAAIEDLLEQTSKIHDQKSPLRSECDEELFASGSNTLAQGDGGHHATLGLSNHWTNRFEKKDETRSHSGDATANVYDHFSETQTDSQVVGYAEDLSGRQMIIDRVRTRSSGMT